MESTDVTGFYSGLLLVAVLATAAYVIYKRTKGK